MKEIKSVVKNLFKTKFLGPESFYQEIQEAKNAKHVQNISECGKRGKTFLHEACITLVSKFDKDGIV